VAFEAVEARVAPGVAPVGAGDAAADRVLPQRYDLAGAIRVVRQMETSAARSAVFAEITQKNAAYRLVDRLYSRADARLIQPLLLLAYMLKCVLSVGPSYSEGAEAVSISQFPNEHRTIDRVAVLVPDVRLMRLTLSHRQLLARGQWREAAIMLGGAGRIFRFLRLLAHTHSFMPAARIASALAFYIRFTRLFAGNPNLGAAIVASNYSPEAVGMAAAAHRHGRRVIYANHAPVPANGAVVPPVLADCALFYGSAIRQTYERRSRCLAEVALIGQPGTARPMQWRDRVETIGIFLTAGTRVDVLQSLVATIRLSFADARIIIRQHPVTLLQTNIAAIGIKDPLTELTIGSPLDADIAACDIVICGNSGVALNVVSGGRPVAYLASLDDAGFDTNGFVQSRLVYAMPWWTNDLYDRLKAFYQVSGWAAIMQSYDAAYGIDKCELLSAAADVLARHLRLGPSADVSKVPAPDLRQVA
jgi:hypothetical protein